MLGPIIAAQAVADYALPFILALGVLVLLAHCADKHWL